MTRYRTLIPNGYGGYSTHPDHIVNPTPNGVEAVAIADRVGGIVEVSDTGVFGWEFYYSPAEENIVVHVDRTPGGGNTARGRSATIFVEYAEGTPQTDVRKAATAHLEAGESLWGDCCRRTGSTARPNMFEFAVYPA